MKRVSLLSIVQLLFLFGIAVCQSNPKPLPLVTPAPTDPPHFTTDQKLTVRDAQRAVDTLEKQISELNLQFEHLKQQAQQRMDQLIAQQKNAQQELENTKQRVTRDVDLKKWVANWDTLEYSPAPVAQVKPAAKNEPKKE